jgi:DNA-directed RNA polymerase specialized sigma subunit
MNTKVFQDSNSSNAAEYIDCIEDTYNFEETFFKLESEKELQYSISKLPENEKELVHMLFYQKSSVKAYADKKDMPYLQAVRIRKRVLRKLGDHLNLELS